MASAAIRHSQPLHDATLSALVEQLLRDQQDRLPNLSHVVVLLPTQGACSQFRKQLLAQLPCDAVLPPWCGSLPQWVNLLSEHSPTGIELLSEQSRRLIFIEALDQIHEGHPQLFRKENRWPITRALLQLFDELTSHQSDIPESLQAWETRLQEAYQSSETLTHLSQEAALVHTLWHAWQNQLSANKQLDRSQHYLLQLGALQQDTAGSLLDDNSMCYVVEQEFSPAEQSFIDTLLAHDRCRVIDRRTTASPASQFVENCFALDLPIGMRSRAANTGDKTESSHNISIFKASSDEQQVRAIDLQIRHWLLQGCNDIAVICEDRKLARRLRAVLERSSIPLQDHAGWSLATTAAASVIERLFECVEQDFEQHPFLDLLKSKFIHFSSVAGSTTGTTIDSATEMESIFRFERDIIKHENISSSLSRYREHLIKRKHKLAQFHHWSPECYDHILDIIDSIESACGSLTSLHRRDTATASEFHQALLTCLQTLNIQSSLQQDKAGVDVLQCLEEMSHSLRVCDPAMSWQDYRVWLASNLEETLFSSYTGNTTVKLMTLEQSRYQTFQTLLIAAADKAFFPGRPGSSPFFNQAVRESLGLTSWQQKQQLRFDTFKATLTSANEVLISCKTASNGEPVPLSPWVESLLKFHSLIYDDPIENTELTSFIQQIDNREIDIDDSGRHAPSPVLQAHEIPQRISASRHQRLIDCPYKFFAADGLKLTAAEEISNELQKSDYGERVHKILHIFHTRVDKQPAPFGKTINTENRTAAIEALIEISKHVFTEDLEQNILHRSWLIRWLNKIPAYIDWQIQHGEQWQIQNTEFTQETILDERVTLYGRLDRIDKRLTDDKQTAIIDYKTGKTRSQQEVDSGEDIQLASYALLQNDCTQVSYLSLDQSDNRVKTTSSLEGEQLADVRHRVECRLKDVIAELHAGKSLPAWGDDSVCQHCQFSGLCRRQYWQDNDCTRTPAV